MYYTVSVKREGTTRRSHHWTIAEARRKFRSTDYRGADFLAIWECDGDRITLVDWRKG